MSSATSSPENLPSFEAPVHALVVGARGGVGSEIALALAKSPIVQRVFGTAREPGDRRLADIAGLSNGKFQSLRMDLTEESSVEAALAEITRETGSLELVINCAGLLHDGDDLGPERRLAHVSPDNLDRLYRVHAIGPLLLAKHAQPLFPRKDRAVFASLSARVGSIGDNRLGGWYAYRMSKAAHNMAVKNLSIELRRRARGMICVSLHPGTVATELSRPFTDNVDEEKLFAPERAARQLLTVIDSLGPADNGEFYAWDGNKIPW